MMHWILYLLLYDLEKTEPTCLFLCLILSSFRHWIYPIFVSVVIADLVHQRMIHNLHTKAGMIIILLSREPAIMNIYYLLPEKYQFQDWYKIHALLLVSMYSSSYCNIVPSYHQQKSREKLKLLNSHLAKIGICYLIKQKKFFKRIWTKIRQRQARE